MSRADRTRDGTQITPIWRCTRSTGETVGAAPNGGYTRGSSPYVGYAPSALTYSVPSPAARRLPVGAARR